jgi:hypothetical protein
MSDEPSGRLWADVYVTVPELRAFAADHGVEVPARVSKLELVDAIRAAGLEPPRPQFRPPFRPSPNRVAE